MKRFQKIINFFLLLLCCTCLCCKKKVEEPERINGPEWITGFEEYLLSAEERDYFEKEALNGSGAAALKLAENYMFFDRDKELYWLNVGAKNGNARCLFDLSYYQIFHSDIPKEVAEGYHGMAVAVSSYDYPEAQVFLENTNSFLFNLFEKKTVIECILIYRREVNGGKYYRVYGEIVVLNNSDKTFEYDLNSILLKSPQGTLSVKNPYLKKGFFPVSVEPGKSKSYPVFWTVERFEESYELPEIEVVLSDY